MDLNEAKQILTNNGFICEAKTIKNLKQMVKNFCDNPDAYKVAKLKKNNLILKMVSGAIKCLMMVFLA